jgi:hypothetical protein
MVVFVIGSLYIRSESLDISVICLPCPLEEKTGMDSIRFDLIEIFHILSDYLDFRKAGEEFNQPSFESWM